MSVITDTLEFPHQRSASFTDEYVDQFSAYTISWNGAEAVHLTFGRDSLEVKSSRLVHYSDRPAESKSGKVDLFCLDVAAISMPIETARRLAETLNTMIAGVEASKR